MKGAHKRWFELLLDGPPLPKSLQAGNPPRRRSKAVGAAELAALFDEAHEIHQDYVPRLPRGPAGLRLALDYLERSFDSFVAEVDNDIHDGDLLVSRCTVRARQSGPIGPFPATYAWMVAQGAIMTRFADGKARETWLLLDPYPALRRLGALADPIRGIAPGDEGEPT